MEPRRRRPALGDLERAVLGALWAGGRHDVRAMHAEVGAARGITPNTVHSALERLVRKGLAERRKVGRAYAYAARVSRDEWLRGELRALVEAAPGADASLLVAAFADLTEHVDGARLAELEALLRARRRSQERGST